MNSISNFKFHMIFFAALYILYVGVLFLIAGLTDLHIIFHTIFRLTAALLEVAVFWLISLFFMKMWLARRNILWYVLSILPALIVCLIYVAQANSVNVANNFISVVAIQNIYYASLTTSSIEILSIVLGLVWIGMLGICVWRGGLHRTDVVHVTPERNLALVLIALVALYAGLFTQQRRHVSLEPDFRQVPVASLAVNTYLAFHDYDAGAGTPVSLNNPCFHDSHAGDIPGYPFEKGTVYSTSLPYADAVKQEPKHPNVIVIFTEGLSARPIGAYGGTHADLTPNIDRFSEIATKVTNYYNHTAPTFRAVIGQTSSGYSFTGGDVWTTGQNKTKLASIKRQTLATILDKRGYETYFFQPEHNGGAFPTMLVSLGFQHVLTFESIAALLRGNIRIQNPYNELDDQTLFHGLTTFLKSRTDTGNNKPFFVALYNIGTHAFIQVVKGGLKYGDGNNDYLNKVHNYDAAVGQFTNFFDKSHYARDTIVIFTTDHATYPDQTYRAAVGKDLKPYFVDKIPLLIYDPLQRLPAILDARGRNSLDLAPTILQILGINNVPNSFLGRSLFENRSFLVGMSAIGSQYFVTTPKGVYALADVPVTLKKTAMCEKNVVRTFYNAEKDNRIFKTTGSGEAVGELAAVHRTAQCALDIINGASAKSAPSVKIGTNATFGGWFADSARRPVSTFKILLHGKSDFSFFASDGTHRPDVIAILGGAPADNYGFAASSDFAGASAGKYEIALITPNGEHCVTHREITLLP